MTVNCEALRLSQGVDMVLEGGGGWVDLPFGPDVQLDGALLQKEVDQAGYQLVDPDEEHPEMLPTGVLRVKLNRKD